MSRLTVAALVVLLGLVAVEGRAQTGAEKLEQTVGETVDTAQRTQEMRDDWAQEKAALETRYRTARSQVDYLAERVTLEQDRADALDLRVAELERRLRESDRLQDVIEDSLAAVFLRFETVVGNDLPFLPDERTRRLNSLRAELARPDVSAAEKLRRLLEAMLVETQYGSSVEVTQEAITFADERIYVDLLRIGRLQLLWMMPDRTAAGTWDPVSESWVELPGEYRRTVARAMEMATRIRPVELVTLPIGRIAP